MTTPPPVDLDATFEELLEAPAPHPWLREPTDDLEPYARSVELLDKLTRLAAFRAYLDELDQAWRAELEAEADRAEAAGGRYSVSVDELGTVYRTQPKGRPYVEDHEAFAAWLADLDPELVRHVRRPVIVDERDLLQALDEFDAAEEAGEVARVREAGRWLRSTLGVDEDAVVDDSILKRLKVTGDRAVDPESGAFAEGVGVRRGSPTLTVKPTGSTVERYRRELTERLSSRVDTLAEGA